MHLILLGLGAAIALAGVALIGFSIPFKEFSLGNTMIIAGAICLVGGLILIGLAAAIGQLRRMVQALESHPMPRALGFDSPEGAPPSLILPSPIEHRAEPAPLVAVDEPHPPADAAESAHSDQIDASGNLAAEMPRANLAETRKPPVVNSPPPAATPPAPADKFAFDAMWMAPSSSPKTASAPPPEPVIAPPPVQDSRPRMSARVMDEYRATVGPAAQTAASPQKEAAVFKSGVIDGMAYTLYTDGSIEAALPQGTVRFGSIEELRNYLGGRE